MLSLLWFGGFFTALREVVKYDEIHEPFRVSENADDDQRNVTAIILMTMMMTIA